MRAYKCEYREQHWRRSEQDMRQRELHPLQIAKMLFCAWKKTVSSALKFRTPNKSHWNACVPAKAKSHEASNSTKSRCRQFLQTKRHEGNLYLLVPRFSNADAKRLLCCIFSTIATLNIKKCKYRPALSTSWHQKSPLNRKEITERKSTIGLLLAFHRG